MSARLPVSHSITDQLVENAKDLIRINGAERQVVVRVTAVVEVETTQHVLAQQPRHNLFDILSLVMVPRIHQHLRLWPGVARENQRHAPIAQVRVVEIRLERLVFHQHPLLGGKVRMRLLQPLGKPLLTVANGSCPRIARTIREPERDVLAARLLADLDALQNMVQRGLANFRVGIAQRPILVNLVLENVGVDRAEANAGLRR